MAAVAVPSVVRATLSGRVDETMRDSGIDMDVKNGVDAADLCGILEHATVDMEDTTWESDSSDDMSSLDEKALSPFDTISDDVADASLTESLLPSPTCLDDRVCVEANDGRPDRGSYMSLNASTCSLASTVREDADAGADAGADGPSGASSVPPRRDVSFDAYYDAPVYSYATTLQPAFPTVFDVFSHDDGVTFYLGGGGRRVPRHHSQRGRGAGAFWPFANPPLYACRLHHDHHHRHASTGRPPVVLYGGLDADRDGAWADVQFGRLSPSVKSIRSLGSITIGLPPVARRRTTGYQPLEDDDDVPAGRTEETLHARLGWHTRYRFEVDVETEADGPASFVSGRRPSRREAFEWRYCSGAELRALDDDDASVPVAAEGGGDRVATPGAPLRRASVKAGQLLRRALSRRSTGAVPVPVAQKKAYTHPTPPRWHAGWQLVRLAESTDPLAEAIRAVQAVQSSTRTTSTAATPSRPSSIVSDLVLDQLIADEAGRAAARRRTSDGREIVALWATQRQEDGDGDDDDDPSDVSSTQTVARFTFLGSGASGQLGERWALMAVMSGLAVWERARRARRRRQSTVVQACGGLANIGA
ncbi:uncharacterized protein SPSK_01108 [Sporothrix schenckii 1099-18]|uniref:Uncharacterized protein n=1 Tax=Sporothrix schenckii 1099-18 TaxID=1397361 RepID=A0A0F2LX98_SPOSC|nr:uncharacterized protein SPSK_01108 [Sporothrix schenckii 1099-18]KJR81454.1 hypothetical protein SPSK_01108 [Sporothrix schenckii 1099-18]